MAPTDLTSDDRVAIMDLLARYARCLDSGDLEGYLALFTHDAVLFEQHHGLERIRTHVEGVMQRRAMEPAPRHHFVGLPVIDGSANRATVHSYLLWFRFGEPAPVVAAGHYVDDCVKRNGRWLFERRVLLR